MKKILTAIMIIISTFTCMVPFSHEVNASNGYIDHGTFVYGDYDLLYTTSGVDLPVASINFGATVLYIKIELDQVYNGTLVVTANGIGSFADFGIIAVGAQISQVSNATNQVQLLLHQSRTIDLLYVSNSSYNTNTNWTLTISGSSMAGLGTELTALRNISTAVTDIDNFMVSIVNDLNDITDALTLLNASHNPQYDLPLTSISAWLFAKNSFNGITYNNGDIYPYFTITDHLLTRAINIPAMQKVEYVFYASQTFTTSGNYHLQSQSGEFSLNLKQINDYRLAGYTLYSVTISNNNLTAKTDRLTYYLASDIQLIPVYLGLPDGMPEDIYKMIYGQSMTEQYLKYITEWLAGYSSVDDDDETHYNNTIINITDYINGLTINLPDADNFLVDFSSLENIEITDEFINVTNFVDYVYNSTTEVFPELKLLVVLSLAALVLGAIL